MKMFETRKHTGAFPVQTQLGWPELSLELGQRLIARARVGVSVVGDVERRGDG